MGGILSYSTIEKFLYFTKHTGMSMPQTTTHAKKEKNLFISDENSRLDAAVSKLLKLSRADAKKIIESGVCRIRGVISQKPSSKISIGDEIEIGDYEQAIRREIALCHLAPTIKYEDEHILVLSKPSGLTVHEGSGTRESTLVDWLKKEEYELAQAAGEKREGIVHRLDKETSGLMVVAKTDFAALGLKEQFFDKSARRIYLAIIDEPLKSDCLIDAKIARHPKNRVKMSVQKDGKEARSIFKKIALSKNGKLELISAKLLTGRTHQIRVHLAHIGRHIVGDDLYGFKSQNAKIAATRVMLHATILELIHPKTGEQMSFFEPISDDFADFLEDFFERESCLNATNKDFIDSIFATHI